MEPLQALQKHLVRSGILDDAQAVELQALVDQSGASLPQVIVDRGIASDAALYESLAEFCEMQFVVPSKMDITKDTVKLVPARIATHYRFIPVQERNGTLVIAIDDPLDQHRMDDIRAAVKRRIDAAVCTPIEIDRAIKRLYGVGADTVERMMSESADSDDVLDLAAPLSGSDLGDPSADASIIKFTNEVLAEAIRSSATDIHMEPFEDELRTRFRIDGVLHGVPTPPSIRGYHGAIVSRLKIMANLDIAEKRLPQDGKIVAALEGDQFDLRISILPTPHGETVNIRILNRSSMFLELEELGFADGDLAQFNRFITRPHGMVLVTGPTGSGKTTTLYAALSKLNKLEHKIITIEDPIEYQLAGITQMQVHERIGFGFANALRSMLRHDPDIMLVGEIRDYETAEMAIRSSLTGHLVFSTLHTNDAAGTVTRLTDMGVEPFLVSSTMIAAIAQRLIRVVCPNCNKTVEPSDEMLREFGVAREDVPADGKFREAAGCDSCRTTGYQGRRAIYEILPFSDSIRDMTIDRASAVDIRRRALKEGMRSLRMAGWSAICRGMSTFEEVMRVTVDSDLESAEG